LIEGTGPESATATRGHFLDLKTLAVCLTGNRIPLASAAKAFHDAHQKTEADYAVAITPSNIGIIAATCG